MLKSESPLYGPSLPLDELDLNPTSNPNSNPHHYHPSNTVGSHSSWVDAAAKAYTPPSLFSAISTSTLVGKGASTSIHNDSTLIQPVLLHIYPSYLLLLSLPLLLFFLRTFSSHPIIRFFIRIFYSFLDFILFRLTGSRPVYCLDFNTFTPPQSWHIPTSKFEWVSGCNFGMPKDSVDFCMKLLGRSGLGEETSFPPGIANEPADIGFGKAREEAEVVIFSILDTLFANNKLKPTDIDILIVNCSLFNPTPSLASMIVNHYKMREDIQSYNLGGMGCSAGVISIHLARQLLQTQSNSLAVVVSTENITQNIYLGAEKGMLISNSLFRCGGAAILLSNQLSDRVGGKVQYELITSVRTHIGSSDESYTAVYQEEDGNGFKGVRLDKQLMSVAAKALKKNITVLAPKILPWTEQIKYGINFGLRMMEKTIWEWRQRKGQKKKGKRENKEGKEKGREGAGEGEISSSNSTSSSGRVQFKGVIREYVPRFDAGIQHFCIHAGGRGVIDAVQQALSLSDACVAASRAVLYRYGNTSSSSIWYELQYAQENGNMKQGDKIWQIAFGSGFKCNSAVWKVVNQDRIQEKVEQQRAERVAAATLVAGGLEGGLGGGAPLLNKKDA